jgi:CBS domain containing-hemolysin-like protein
VPVVGESIDHEGWRMTVEAIEGRRIRTLRITPLVESD